MSYMKLETKYQNKGSGNGKKIFQLLFFEPRYLCSFPKHNISHTYRKHAYGGTRVSEFLFRPYTMRWVCLLVKFVSKTRAKREQNASKT